MTHPQVVALPQLVTVPDVEICAAGTWGLSTGEVTFTAEDFAAAVQASQCPAVGSPVLKLGHLDPRFNSPEYDAQPGLGRVANMRLTAGGAKISGDLAGMPAWLAAALPSAYPNRSIEGAYGYRCQIGHTHPFVITGLALLGVTPPGVGVLSTLKDVAALYGVAAAALDQGSTWTLRIGGVMADAAPNAATTVEDIRRSYYDDPSTPPTMWITEIQLAPLQMIVADEAQGTLCRVPVKIGSGGTVSFGDPVPVQVSYVDAPEQKTAASAAIPLGRALAVAAKLRGQADDQLAQHASREISARDQQRIAAAIGRGAIPASRAEFYAAQAAAGHDISALDQLAAVIPVAAGMAAAAASPEDADYERLFVARAPQADDSGPEYGTLFGSVEEGQRKADEVQAARRNEVAALSDDELYSSLFPPAASRTDAAAPVAASAAAGAGQHGQAQAGPQRRYRVRAPLVSLRVPNGVAAGADPARTAWRTIELRGGDRVPEDAHPDDVKRLLHQKTRLGPMLKPW